MLLKKRSRPTLISRSSRTRRMSRSRNRPLLFFPMTTTRTGTMMVRARGKELDSELNEDEED